MLKNLSVAWPVATEWLAAPVPSVHGELVDAQKGPGASETKKPRWPPPLPPQPPPPPTNTPKTNARGEFGNESHSFKSIAKLSQTSLRAVPGSTSGLRGIHPNSHQRPRFSTNTPKTKARGEFGNESHSFKSLAKLSQTSLGAVPGSTSGHPPETPP